MCLLPSLLAVRVDNLKYNKPYKSVRAGGISSSVNTDGLGTSATQHSDQLETNRPVGDRIFAFFSCVSNDRVSKLMNDISERWTII